MSYPITEIDSEVGGNHGSTVDIKRFLLRLLGFLPWIVLSVLLCYTIARLYLRYTPEVHKVSAYVLIKDDEENSSDYKVLRELGVMPGSKEVQNQIDILESFDISSALVDSLDLNIQLVSKGRIASSPIYGSSRPVFIQHLKFDTIGFVPATYQLKVFKDSFSINEGNKQASYRYGDTFRLADHPFCFLRNESVFADPDGYTILFLDKKAVAANVRNAFICSKNIMIMAVQLR